MGFIPVGPNCHPDDAEGAGYENTHKGHYWWFATDEIAHEVAPRSREAGM
jgi:hypothetical protein